MRVVKRYKIDNNASLIFAKRDSKQYLNEILTFALMELGTNIIKYAKKGEIWILEEDEKFAVAACDKGEGIENIEWALQKGTTTSKNSLGLGLNRLSNNKLGKFYIFSKKNFGSVVIFSQIEEKEITYLSLSLCKDNGDFFAKKGKFLIFGDAVGHGRNANKSGEFIKTYFFNYMISCLFINDFFKELHYNLRKKGLRGAVLVVIENTKKFYNICGVGNITLLVNKEIISLKDGVLGESFSSSDKKSFTKPIDITFCTDGIDISLVKQLDIKEPILRAVSSCFFSEILDDKSILILRS